MATIDPRTEKVKRWLCGVLTGHDVSETDEDILFAAPLHTMLYVPCTRCGLFVQARIESEQDRQNEEYSIEYF